MNMEFGRFHGRNISYINSNLSPLNGAFLAGIVTGASSGSVYELAVSVTHGDYSGQPGNLSPSLTPDAGTFGSYRTAVIADQPQFAPPQRRVDTRRKQAPRRAVARLRQSNRNIRIGPERKRLSLAAVSVLVVPVPAALRLNEQIKTSAEGDSSRVSNPPVDARTLPVQSGLLDRPIRKFRDSNRLPRRCAGGLRISRFAHCE